MDEHSFVLLHTGFLLLLAEEDPSNITLIHTYFFTLFLY